MPQVYLFATLTQQEGKQPLIIIRYLHATRETKEEADALCQDLNKMMTGAEFGVVGDE